MYFQSCNFFYCCLCFAPSFLKSGLGFLICEKMYCNFISNVVRLDAFHMPLDEKCFELGNRYFSHPQNSFCASYIILCNLSFIQRGEFTFPCNVIRITGIHIVRLKMILKSCKSVVAAFLHQVHPGCCTLRFLCVTHTTVTITTHFDSHSPFTCLISWYVVETGTLGSFGNFCSNPGKRWSWDFDVVFMS